MNLIETHIIGSRTRERIVSPAECPALAEHGVRLCGVSDARPPYRMVRPRIGWTEHVFTVSGTGSVWADDGWRRVGAGEAYIAQAGAAQALQVPPGKRLRFAWVHSESTSAKGACARVVKADGETLASVIAALHHEVLGHADGTILTHLAALVARLVGRLESGTQTGQRLHRLWRAVDANLAHPWTIPSLAATALMSGEHLRRLCLAERNQSPMEYVTELRMRRAAALLRANNAKVETIAYEVGYGSVYSFSAAFRRWCGKPPGEWRRGG